MSQQLRRQLNILRTLPKANRAISTAEVYARMENQGYRCSRRTIERDLSLLATVFPNAIKVITDESTQTNSWGLIEGKPLLPEVLFNNSDLALAMTLLKQQAYSRLPLRIFNILKPLWEQAGATAEQDLNARKWLEFTRYLPSPLRPESPEIKADVQNTIEKALLDGDFLNLCVNTLDGQTDYQGLIPIRLIQRDELMLLLAQNPAAENDDELICIIPMHCIVSATSRVNLEGGSDIDPDIAQQYALNIGDFIQLRVRISRKLAEELFARPIGNGQSITACSQKPVWYVLETIIEDGPELKKWLAWQQQDNHLEMVKG